MTGAATSAAEINNRFGAFLLVAAAAFFTAEVVIVRLIAETVSNEQIVFARAAVQLAGVTAWIWIADRDALVTGRPGLHLLRGLTSLASWWLYYQSFKMLDLALATTLTFTTSLFVVAIAAPLLGEKVGFNRALMTGLGFVGVVAASGATSFNIAPGVFLGLAAAAASAVLVYLNRMLTRTEATTTIMFYIGLVATVGTLPSAILSWQPLSTTTAALLVLAASLGTVGMFLGIEAYRVGEVSALAPFPYVRLVFAITAGFAIYGEIPTLSTLVGGAIIIACALSVSRHERRRGLRLGV